jgi:small membrane protein
MNALQVLVVLLFVTLAVLTLSAGMRGTVPKRVVAAALLLWAFGGVATVWPTTVPDLSRALGLGGGVDLLVYVTTLSLAVVCFYMYMRFRRVERQLTLLVRRLAMDSAAQRGIGLEPPMRSSIPSDALRRSDAGPRLIS